MFVVGVPAVQFARDNIAVVITVVIVLLAGVGAAFYARSWLRRRRLERDQDRLRAVLPFHAMDDKQFEHALASLCRSAGCRDVEVSGGSGDRGADVIAVTADGRRLIVQAKRYNINHAVGDRELQQRWYQHLAHLRRRGAGHDVAFHPLGPSDRRAYRDPVGGQHHAGEMERGHDPRAVDMSLVRQRNGDWSE
ncbi:restriction endonuclease [Nocardia fusca]